MLAMTGSPIPPVEQLVAGAAAILLLPALILWLVMRGKLRRVQRESAAALEQLRTESGAALTAEQAKAAAFAAESGKKSAEAAASFADLQQRFNTHREVAERRANDASRQISQLEAELATTREVAAQLVPTQSRIKDLETALAAEQGRVQAQEQAIAATNARAADFEKRMIDAKDLLLKHKAEMQETAVELKKVRDEQAAYAAAGGPEAELAKAHELNQQAEAKVANLQRALKAAEARTEMVQKEFMTAVGVATAPAMGNSASQNEKKLRDLEEKLGLVEAESRKRAREDGYKIAELEYRLSEAVEVAKVAQAQAQAAAPPIVPPPTAPAPESEMPKPEPVHVAAHGGVPLAYEPAQVAVQSGESLPQEPTPAAAPTINSDPENAPATAAEPGA